MIKDPVIRSSQNKPSGKFSGKIVTYQWFSLRQLLCLSVHTIFSLVVSEKIRFNWLWQIFKTSTNLNLTELFALSSSLNKPSNLLLLVSPVVKLKQNNLLLVYLARGWSNEEFSVIIRQLIPVTVISSRSTDQTSYLCLLIFYIYQISCPMIPVLCLFLHFGREGSGLSLTSSRKCSDQHSQSPAGTQ